MRSPVLLQAEEEPAQIFAVTAPPAVPLVTLPSLDIAGIAMRPSPALRGRAEAAAAAHATLATEGPPSTPISDSVVPSSRRETMSALRPVSVPPSRISGLPSGYLLQSVAPPASGVRSPIALFASGIVAVAGAVAFALAPAASPARTFGGLHADVLWTHRGGRLASGYVVVALLVAGMGISLRKRCPRFRHGSVAGLRVIHGVLGALALAGVACHTGLHGGERLNRLLALDFLAATAVGGVAAAATAIAGPRGSASVRLLFTRAHVFVLVPLPVLLVLHVVGAYYF
jgi:hypothetical protein